MKIRHFVVILASMSAACANNAAVNNTPAVNSNGASASASPAMQNLALAERPEKIKDQMSARGEQDQAAPTLKILVPAANANIASSTVKVRLAISGDLKGYKPHKDPQTQMGNHIHVILDNQPYEAYYNLEQEFELRNVADGEHTLRVFPSRPWHESYKNNGGFQMVKFAVKNGGADTTKPATTNSGQPMSNANAASPSNANTNANSASVSEGKDMQTSTAGPVDASKPLLTYSRPKGEYKGAEADAIMIDFWLANARLVGGGGEHRVRYAIDGGEARFIDKWEPIWLSGWAAGKHSIRIELIDRDGKIVDNGGYNSTTREITVIR